MKGGKKAMETVVIWPGYLSGYYISIVYGRSSAFNTFLNPVCFSQLTATV